MEETPPRKRKSLRDSVLKRPRDRDRSVQTYDDNESSDWENFHPERNFFGGFGPMFDMDKEDFPFGFQGFGNMDHFGEHFNEMMSRFFSDFQPESFADSRFFQEDRDLDQDVSRKGLDRVLKPRPNLDRPHSYFSGFSSHSESIMTRPDGTKERRVTHKDSQGNSETTVTITHPDGTTETIRDGDSSHTDRDPIEDELVSVNLW